MVNPTPEKKSFYNLLSVNTNVSLDMFLSIGDGHVSLPQS